MVYFHTKTIAHVFLLLLLSNEAIEVKKRVEEVVLPVLDFEGDDAKSHVYRLVTELDSAFLEIPEDKVADELTPKQIIEIQESLNKNLRFKGSPVLLELNAMTPAKLGASAAEMVQHKNEISEILQKSTEPLHHVVSLLEMVTSSKKSAAEWPKWMANVHKTGSGNMNRATTTSNAAKGNCERSTSFTCGHNEECVSAEEHPCQGFCQCNTDGLNSCECVKEVKFSGPFAAALNDEKNIDGALTFKGGAVEGIYGLIDGFLGGTFSDIRTPWNNNPQCLQMRDDFSGGMKEVIHSFKVLLHTVRRQTGKVLFEKAARTKMKEAIKTAVKAIVEFLKSVTPGLWKCPATRLIMILLGVFAAAIRINMLMFAYLGPVIPIIIKWVGAIIGLYFSFSYLKGAFGKLKKNLLLKRDNKCSLDCKKKITFNSFAIVGCLLEVVLMGAVADVFKIKQLKISPSLKHDVSILRDAAVAAKHGKAGQKVGNLVQRFKMKRPPKELMKKTIRRQRDQLNARTLQRGAQKISSRISKPRSMKKSEADLESLWKTTLDACDKKEWHGVYAAHKGVCEDKRRAGSCQDGVFIRGYCSGKPRNIKCCMRTKCYNDKGMCTISRKCGPGRKLLSGHCPGPAYVKCCVPEDSNENEK
jgi:hypothetical protein